MSNEIFRIQAATDKTNVWHNVDKPYNTMLEAVGIIRQLSAQNSNYRLRIIKITETVVLEL